MVPGVKVLFLGIDAGDKYLLQSWAAEGTLPVLRSLLATGLAGDSLSVNRPVTGPIGWSSMVRKAGRMLGHRFQGQHPQ